MILVSSHLRDVFDLISTLRSGSVKRSEPGEADEEMLFMRTVRLPWTSNDNVGLSEVVFGSQFCVNCVNVGSKPLDSHGTLAQIVKPPVGWFA